MMRQFLFLGAVSALLCVAIGAFGAHGLKGYIADKLLDNYQTGVLYHMFHSFGLLAVGLTGLLAERADERTLKLLNRAGWLLLTGIVLFSGSLYVMALTGFTWLGAITPLGGLAFLAGWACLAAAVRRI